jgi:hypothetical protein
MGACRQGVPADVVGVAVPRDGRMRILAVLFVGLFAVNERSQNAEASRSPASGAG